MIRITFQYCSGISTYTYTMPPSVCWVTWFYLLLYLEYRKKQRCSLVSDMCWKDFINNNICITFYSILRQPTPTICINQFVRILFFLLHYHSCYLGSRRQTSAHRFRLPARANHSWHLVTTTSDPAWRKARATRSHHVLHVIFTCIDRDIHRPYQYRCDQVLGQR